MGIFDKQGAYQEFKPLFTAQFDTDKTVDKLNKAYEQIDNTLLNATPALVEEQPFANKIREDYDQIRNKVAEGTLSPLKAASAVRQVAHSYANDPMRIAYERSNKAYEESLEEAKNNANRDKAANFNKNTFLFDKGGSKNGSMEKFTVPKEVSTVEVLNKFVSDIKANKYPTDWGISEKDGIIQINKGSTKEVTKKRVQQVYEGLIGSEPALQEQFKVDAYDDEFKREYNSLRAKGVSDIQARAVAHKTILEPRKNKDGSYTSLVDDSVANKNKGFLSSMLGKAAFMEIEKDVNFHNLPQAEGANMYPPMADVADLIEVDDARPEQPDMKDVITSGSGVQWGNMMDNLFGSISMGLDLPTGNVLYENKEVYKSEEQVKDEIQKKLTSARDTWPAAGVSIRQGMSVDDMKKEAEKVNKYFATHNLRGRVKFATSAQQEEVTKQIQNEPGLQIYIPSKEGDAGWVPLNTYIDKVIEDEGTDAKNQAKRREEIKKSITAGGLTTKTGPNGESTPAYHVEINGKPALIKTSTAINGVTADFTSFNDLATDPNKSEIRLSNGQILKKFYSYDPSRNEGKLTFTSYFPNQTPSSQPQTLEQMASYLGDEVRRQTLYTPIRRMTSSTEDKEKVPRVKR